MESALGASWRGFAWPAGLVDASAPAAEIECIHSFVAANQVADDDWDEFVDRVVVVDREVKVVEHRVAVAVADDDDDYCNASFAAVVVDKC